MESFVHISLADALIAGSAVLFGVTAFVLVRLIYPERLLEDVRARASEARLEAEAAREAGRRVPQPRGQMALVGNALVQRLGDWNTPWVKDRWRDKMKRRFVAMGQPELRSQDFMARQEIWCIFFGLTGLIILNFFGQPLWYAIAAAVFGWVFPYIWLHDQIRKRQRAIGRSLPYNMDLLTLSVEAGLDFQAALGTVVEKGQPGPLQEELNILLSEIRLGKTRSEALRNLADRIQMTEVSAFVANLIQADKMGTSLGKVLRIQSTQMRIARTHRAEKLANEAPVKMLLPLIGCIFPTVFLILFGPIVYRFMYGG